MKINQIALAAAVSVMLTACGGSSDSSDDSNNSSSSSSSAGNTSSSSSSSSSVDDIGSGAAGNEYDGDWGSCERLNTTQGFATLDGGTTGGADVGGGNEEVGVTNGVELRALLDSSDEDVPLTIYIDDLITWENSGNDPISISRENVSILGRSDNAGFEGVGIELGGGASNIIIRNLELRLVPQSNGTGDLISLDGRNGAVRNIWIDHNEMYNSLEAPAEAECGFDEDCNKDYYDELVSGRGAVQNVTISYNYMHDSWKTSLWGSSDDAAEDAGRTITFHHNYWHGVNSRLPLFRYGEGHIFNNYYHNVESSAINARMGAEMRIDGNVFENVNSPIVSLYSEEVGYWDVYDNIFEDISGGNNGCNDGVECTGAEGESTTTYLPEYDYDVMPSEDVVAYVTEQAGVGKIDACLDFPAPEEPVEPKDPPSAWNMFRGNSLPDTSGAIELENDDTAEFTLGGDMDVLTGGYFSAGAEAGTIDFDSTADSTHKYFAEYANVVNNTADYPKHFTFLAGVTGNDEDFRVLEIEVAMADDGETGSRLKTILRADGDAQGIQLEQADAGGSPDFYDLDMNVFRVYQVNVTLHSDRRGDVNVFIEGNDAPVIALRDVLMRSTAGEGANFISIGDGGSHPYKSNLDWLIWTNEDAYRPSDLHGKLPEGLGVTTGYDAE